MKHPNMNIRLTIAIATLIVAIAFNSCKNQTAKPPQQGPVPVNVATVKQGNASFYDNYPGTVVAVNQVDLRSDVSGFITAIFFTEGETVHKGQKLYEIDQSKYQANYDQAKANVDIAQANLEKAQRDADRYQSLAAQDAIAKQTLDNGLTALQNAKLTLASAKADAVKAKTDLNYSTITAPFDGTIGISQVKMGTLVSQGQTLLNTISSDDPIYVDFSIDEKELSHFVDLNKKTESKGDSTFRILLPDNTYYGNNGKISLIDRAIDPQTGTIKVRLTFANHDRKLRPGLSVTAKVLNSTGSQQLMIPYKAVMEQMGEYYTFVVDANKVKQTRVELGARLGDEVVVRSGLSANQQIVTDGIQKMRDGAAIQVGAPAPAAQ